MRDVIREALFNYFLCCVLGGILSILAPERVKNTLKIIVVGIILISVFSPFLNIDGGFKNIKTDILDIEDTEINGTEHLKNLIEERVYKRVREVLINLNIDEYEIYVDTSIASDKKSIVLNEINIKINSQYNEKISEIKDNLPEEYRSILKVGVKNE